MLRGVHPGYYGHFGSLPLFQLDGPDGPMWRDSSAALLHALAPHQKGAQDGCQAGSWDPSVERWGFVGGRVCATAINALTLETCRRYPDPERVQEDPPAMTGGTARPSPPAAHGMR